MEIVSYLYKDFVTSAFNLTKLYDSFSSMESDNLNENTICNNKSVNNYELNVEKASEITKCIPKQNNKPIITHSIQVPIRIAKPIQFECACCNKKIVNEIHMMRDCMFCTQSCRVYYFST